MRRARRLTTAVVLALGLCRAVGALGASTEAGKKVYDQKCAQCHGEKGDGNGVAKLFFLPRPRDFTYGLFKIRTTPSGAVPTDGDLERVIRKGMPYTGMPAWPGLSDDELSAVVAYVKSFSPAFGGEAPEAIEIPNPPGASDESLQRGRKVFEENKCVDCHGNLGRGDGKSAATLKNDWNDPIRPADLTRRWTFRGGSSRRDIYRTFTTGLNGSPMPSYADLIGEEDRWHLVNYVYSLSRDDPDYATVVKAVAVEGEIEPARNQALFDQAPPAYFPVIGQVIEPGRDFFPSADGIEVRAVYNATDIAVMLAWDDMTGSRSGTNGPSLPAPDSVSAPTPGEVYSDAVAIQTPSQATTGSVKPYFLFGDAKNPVDLWFADLARGGAQRLVGRGSQNVQSTADTIAAGASYADGRWTVVFKRSRHPEGGLAFDEGRFVPVAFSVWDGFNFERGNRRGVTSWYHIYLQPAATESRTIPVAGYGLLTLFVEVVIIRLARWRHRKPGPPGGA